MWLPEAWEQFKAAREALANTTGSSEVIFKAQSSDLFCSGCKTSESDKQALLEKSARKKVKVTKNGKGGARQHDRIHRGDLLCSKL